MIPEAEKRISWFLIWYFLLALEIYFVANLHRISPVIVVAAIANFCLVGVLSVLLAITLCRMVVAPERFFYTFPLEPHMVWKNTLLFIGALITIPIGLLLGMNPSTFSIVLYGAVLTMI